MELILKATIDTLGEEGDIVKVKDGYGRNYLLPEGKAVVATKSNLAILEKEKEKDVELILFLDQQSLPINYPTRGKLTIPISNLLYTILRSRRIGLSKSTLL